MVPEPAVAVTVPPQPLPGLDGVATTRFVGSVSVKLALIGTTLTVLSMKKVMVATFTFVPVPPVVWIVGMLKLLVIEGGARMSMFALAAPPLDGPKPDVLAV